MDAYRATTASPSDDDGDMAWETATIDFWLSSMVASLLLNTFDEWKDARYPCIKRLLALVAHDTPQLAQRKGEDKGIVEGGGDAETEREYLFLNRLIASRPILLFFLLIQHIHTLLHSPPFSHPPSPHPPPVQHWRSSSSSPPSSLPLHLATRFSFLQRFDSRLIQCMQSGGMISELMRHGSSRHDSDGLEAAQAELEELCRLCGVWEDVKAEYGTAELMMREAFTLEDTDTDNMQQG